MTVTGPLSGVTVVELARSVAAPDAGLILADHGAQVIGAKRLQSDRGRQIPLRDGHAFEIQADNSMLPTGDRCQGGLVIYKSRQPGLKGH